MQISPNSELIMIWGCPCTKDYRHSLHFQTVEQQTEYFTNLNARCGDKVSTDTGSEFYIGMEKLLFTKLNYVRIDQRTVNLKVRDKVSIDTVSNTTEYIQGYYNAEKLLTCNYMAFKNTSFGNKWFYAFVDNAKYLNNGVVQIEYTIDVLQTWWFDLKFGECYVERETSLGDLDEEILTPENLPTGDEIIYDSFDIPIGLTETVTKTEKWWANANPDKWNLTVWDTIVGGNSALSRGVAQQEVGVSTTQPYDYYWINESGVSVKYNSVIRVAFYLQPDISPKTTHLINEFLKGFGDDKQAATLCVCDIPVLTDYTYFYDNKNGWLSRWYSDEDADKKTPYPVLGFGIVDSDYHLPSEDFPLPSPKQATALWLSLILKNISSVGGTIVNCWQIPSKAFDMLKNSTTERIEMLKFTGSFKNTIRGYTHTPKNRKMFTHPYTYISVINNNSDERIFKPQLFNSLDGYSNFEISVEDGAKFLMALQPENYNGSNGLNYEELILSGEYPTLAWGEDSFTKWDTQYGLQFRLGAITKQLNVAATTDWSNKIGIAKGVVKSVSNVLDDIGTYSTKKRAYDDVNGSIGNTYLNLQNDKYFTIYTKGITADNARVIDDYFTVFGYAVKKYKTPYIAYINNNNKQVIDYSSPYAYNLRRRFNYIQCNDTNIDTEPNKYINANDIDKIEQIFNNGITFWEVYGEDGGLINEYYTLDYNNYKPLNAIRREELI